MHLPSIYIWLTCYFQERFYIVVPQDLDERMLEWMIAPDFRAALKFVSEARGSYEHLYSLDVPQGMLAAKVFTDTYGRYCRWIHGEPAEGRLLDGWAERRFAQYQYMLLVTRDLRQKGMEAPEENLTGFDYYERAVKAFAACDPEGRHRDITDTVPPPRGCR